MFRYSLLFAVLLALITSCSLPPEVKDYSDVTITEVEPGRYHAEVAVRYQLMSGTILIVTQGALTDSSIGCTEDTFTAGRYYCSIEPLPAGVYDFTVEAGVEPLVSLIGVLSNGAR